MDPFATAVDAINSRDKSTPLITRVPWFLCGNRQAFEYLNDLISYSSNWIHTSMHIISLKKRFKVHFISSSLPLHVLGWARIWSKLIEKEKWWKIYDIIGEMYYPANSSFFSSFPHSLRTRKSLPIPEPCWTKSFKSNRSKKKCKGNNRKENISELSSPINLHSGNDWTICRCGAWLSPSASSSYLLVLKLHMLDKLQACTRCE